jgi:hypothetical protein
MREALLDIRDKIKDRIYKNEEHVRLSLVTRVVQELGWNIWDPSEVNAEFVVIPTEDQARIDLALFLSPYEPSVFVEIKAIGKLEGNIKQAELQLRDYNRNNTALFSIFTDGQKWRFYYSQTGGEFSLKCFKTLDILDDNLEDLELYFYTFLSKKEIANGNAQREAENYLQSSKIQRAIEDVLPKARRMVQEPPYLSLPKAVVRLLADKNVQVTEEKVTQSLQDIDIPERPVQETALKAHYQSPNKVLSGRHQSNQSEATYIKRYRKMLQSSNTLPSKIKKYVNERGSVTYSDLKRACVERFGCRNELSGSIGASVKVLEIDGYIRIEGHGDYKRISILRNE